MGPAQDQQSDQSGLPDERAREPGMLERARAKMDAGNAKAREASDRHISIAVPFRAIERNRRSAASVLACGIAYRIFSWLLPFGLIVGGALGLGDAENMETAVSDGGLPQAVVNAVGDISRAADSTSWWLLVAGVPLLVWEGYKGAKALVLIHALVWNEPVPHVKPLKSSAVFTGTVCLFLAAVSLGWWLRDATETEQLLVWAAMILPLAAGWLQVSLWLPHGKATWKQLLPGAFLVAVGFQITHGLVTSFLAPKLEKETALFGVLGFVTTLLFFMWVVGRIVVTAPILNSSLHDELRGSKPAGGADAAPSLTAPPR